MFCALFVLGILGVKKQSLVKINFCYICKGKFFIKKFTFTRFGGAGKKTKEKIS